MHLLEFDWDQVLAVFKELQPEKLVRGFLALEIGKSLYGCGLQLGLSSLKDPKLLQVCLLDWI